MNKKLKALGIILFIFGLFLNINLENDDKILNTESTALAQTSGGSSGGCEGSEEGCPIYNVYYTWTGGVRSVSCSPGGNLLCK